MICTLLGHSSLSPLHGLHFGGHESPRRRGDQKAIVNSLSIGGRSVRSAPQTLYRAAQPPALFNLLRGDRAAGWARIHLVLPSAAARPRTKSTLAIVAQSPKKSLKHTLIGIAPPSAPLCRPDSWSFFNSGTKQELWWWISFLLWNSGEEIN